MGRIFFMLFLWPLGVFATDVSPATISDIYQPLRLELREGLVTEAKAGGNVAVSGEIVNTSSETVVITGAESPLSGQTLMQALRMENGFKFIKMLKTLEIPAKSMVELIPGELELRLVGLTQDLQSGNELPLSIKDSRGRTQTLRVKIIQGYTE